MHFLYPREVSGIRHVRKPWASVTFELTKGGHKPELTIKPDIGIFRTGVALVPLPERVTLLDNKGAPMKAGHGQRFWVTTESFDPMHAVTLLTEEHEKEILS